MTALYPFTFHPDIVIYFLVNIPFPIGHWLTVGRCMGSRPWAIDLEIEILWQRLINRYIEYSMLRRGLN